MTSPTTLRAEWAMVLQAKRQEAPTPKTGYKAFRQAWAAFKARKEVK